VEKVQQAGDYSIYQKRSGRYAVRDKNKCWVNAEEKTKILLDAGLINICPPKLAAADEAAETTSEGTAGSEEAGQESAS